MLTCNHAAAKIIAYTAAIAMQEIICSYLLVLSNSTSDCFLATQMESLLAAVFCKGWWLAATYSAGLRWQLRKLSDLDNSAPRPQRKSIVGYAFYRVLQSLQWRGCRVLL